MHPSSKELANNDLPWTRISRSDGQSPRTHTVQTINNVFLENGNIDPEITQIIL